MIHSFVHSFPIRYKSTARAKRKAGWGNVRSKGKGGKKGTGSASDPVRRHWVGERQRDDPRKHESSLDLPRPPRASKAGLPVSSTLQHTLKKKPASRAREKERRGDKPRHERRGAKPQPLISRPSSTHHCCRVQSKETPPRSPLRPRLSPLSLSLLLAVLLCASCTFLISLGFRLRNLHEPPSRVFLDRLTGSARGAGGGGDEQC